MDSARKNIIPRLVERFVKLTSQRKHMDFFSRPSCKTGTRTSPRMVTRMHGMACYKTKKAQA